MDKEMEIEFNEKIMNALMKKAQDSSTRCDALEKNLGVKEAELQYLAKLYDEETSSLTKELEREKEKATRLEGQLNDMNDKFSEVNNELNIIRSEKNNICSKLPLMEEEIEKLKKELEVANSKISQQESQIQKLSEEIKNKDIIIEEQTTHYQELEIELREYKGPEIIANDSSNGDRLKCYKCGSVGKDIKVVEDKSKPLSYVGNMPMYAKYHICKRCGFQF